MKVAYLTEFDLKKSSRRSNSKDKTGQLGCFEYIANSLETQGLLVDYITPKKIQKTLLSPIKWRWYQKISKQSYHQWAEPEINKRYAVQINQKLSSINSDIVLSSAVNLTSYLKCQHPIVMWVDTTYAGLIDFYPNYCNMCQESLNHLKTLDRLAIKNCSLVILSSTWAAQTVIERYSVDPSKVKVVPFGANLECDRTIDDVNLIIQSRPSNVCKLIFVGVDWLRKGGDLALKVAKRLNEAGLPTELTLVGGQPISEEVLPDFVYPLGFIDTSHQKGLLKLNNLLAQSHFLVLPTRADASPHVLCEANSFALPCLTTKVGGLSTIIKDNLNGKRFSLDTYISECCDYITHLMQNKKEYHELALSSFNEYQSRLNWSVSSQIVNKLFQELIH